MKVNYGLYIRTYWSDWVWNVLRVLLIGCFNIGVMYGAFYYLGKNHDIGISLYDTVAIYAIGLILTTKIVTLNAE